MGPYDDRRDTLDPGLIALVLRARRAPPGRYPFLDGVIRPRHPWVLGTGMLAACRAVWRGWRTRRRPAPAA